MMQAVHHRYIYSYFTSICIVAVALGALFKYLHILKRNQVMEKINVFPGYRDKLLSEAVIFLHFQLD